MAGGVMTGEAGRDMAFTGGFDGYAAVGGGMLEAGTDANSARRSKVGQPARRGGSDDMMSASPGCGR